MLKWIGDLASPRSNAASVDARKALADNDAALMADLVVAEVEGKIYTFESEKSVRQSRESLRERVPDYSWLVSDPDKKPRKFLTFVERTRLDGLCQQVRPEEWATVLSTWKARCERVTRREDFIEHLVNAIRESIESRPRPSSVSEVLLSYIRTGSGVNLVISSKIIESFKVGDSPRGRRDGSDSARSLRDIAFNDPAEMV